MKKEKKNKEKKDGHSALKWVITVSILTFTLSIIFSFISTNAMNGLGIILATFVLLGIILLGILFDVVSMSVTVAKEEEFHAKASKRVFGAKTAIKLIRNSEKVSSMCADVIGDICGVLSGAVGAILTMKITETMGLEFDIQFVISAIVASLTVGGKAAGKYIAKANSTKIVSGVSKIVNVFSFKKDK